GVATRGLADQAAALGVDPARLAVGGASAGGNLATVVSLMACERGGPALVFQLLIYPVTDAALDTPSARAVTSDAYPLNRADMEWFWGHYLRDAADRRDPRASPALARSLAGLPPAPAVPAAPHPPSVARCPAPRPPARRRPPHLHPLRRRPPRLRRHGGRARQGTHGGSGVRPRPAQRFRPELIRPLTLPSPPPGARELQPLSFPAARGHRSPRPR